MKLTCLTASWRTNSGGVARNRSVTLNDKGPGSLQAPPPAVPLAHVCAPRLLHRVHHIEDRQVHRHDHSADDDAEHDDHDRLHQ